MKIPITSALDHRFSDPDAEPTSWDQASRELEAAELFWITTVRTDGRPHNAPLVAVWVDDTLYFCTGDEEQKAINVAANPHVILMTGRNSWDEGLDIVVEGEAVRITDHMLLERLARAWKTKWDGRWQYEVGDAAFKVEDTGVALVFGVRPAKVLAFGKGTFSQTRHEFFNGLPSA